MSWQDILKINVDEEKLRQLVSEKEFNELTQGEPAPKKTGVSRLQQLREATGERIEGRDDSKGRVMARKPEPEKTPEQKEQEKQQRMARRKEGVKRFGSALLGGEKAKERRRKIYSKGKDWKDALQRRRQEISERGPSPGDRREEARHAKQAEERKKRRTKAAEDKVIREQARQARIKAQKDKRDAKLQAQGERNKAAREKMFANMKRRDAAAAERRRLANDPAYREEKRAKREKAIEERRRTNPYGTVGFETYAQPGRPSSANPNIQNPSIEAQRKQKELNEQTEQTTQALKNAANSLNKSVIKMNNDKYNAEQKSEPNKNFTPFVPLEKKRVMPEKQNKIPGVIQHSRPKRKKTENKW